MKDKTRVAIIAMFALLLALAGSTEAAWADSDDDDPSAVSIRDSVTLDSDAAAPTQTLQRSGSGLCCPVPKACPCPTSCWSNPLFSIPCLDPCLDQYRKGRDESCLKIGVGAYNWWNYQNDGGEFTYGFPGAEGTYFYYLTGDIECKSCSCVKYGAHVEVRFRDDTTFRPFIPNQVWLYEAYAFVKTPGWGMLKAGKVWTRFGLDWDGSFWGNVQYYNGFKLDPEWGFSWEHSREWTRLSLPVFAQFFIGEDGINGSIVGGDSESSAIYDEEWTGVVRVAPTYHVNTATDVTFGLSGLVGGISNTNGPDDTRTAFAADLTVAWCGLKVYGEYTVLDGVVNEAHYVTGGPSDNKVNYLVGAQYTYGPLTGRATFSHGEYKNPGGEEDLLLLGLDIVLTKWLTFTFEYVDWQVQATGGAKIPFEDGLQFVLHWNI